MQDDDDASSTASTPTGDVIKMDTSQPEAPSEHRPTEPPAQYLTGIPRPIPKPAPPPSHARPMAPVQPQMASPHPHAPAAQRPLHPVGFQPFAFEPTGAYARHPHPVKAEPIEIKPISDADVRRDDVSDARVKPEVDPAHLATPKREPDHVRRDEKPMTSRSHQPLPPHAAHPHTDHLSRLVQMSSTDYLTSAVRSSLYPVRHRSRSPRSRDTHSPLGSHLTQFHPMTSRPYDVPPLRDASPSRAPAAVELKASIPPLNRQPPASVGAAMTSSGVVSSAALPHPPPLVSLPQNAVSMTQPPTLSASTPASFSSAHQMTSSYAADEARGAAWRKELASAGATQTPGRPRSSPPQQRSSDAPAADVIDVDLSDASDDFEMNREEPEATVVDEELMRTKNAMWVEVVEHIL